MSPDGPPISENMQQTLDAMDSITGNRRTEQTAVEVVAKTLRVSEDEATILLLAAFHAASEQDTFEQALQLTFALALELGENRGYARAMEDLAREGSDR